MNYLNFHKQAPDKGYWDQELLNDIASDLDNIYLLPARQNKKHVKEVNKYLKNKEGVLILTGDEENEFPVHRLNIPHKIYQMTPRSKSNHVDRYIPNGYSPAVKHIEYSYPTKRWSFAGQVTHRRRKLVADQLKKLEGGALIKTDGFTKGLPPDKYMHLIQDSKVVICPSGPVIPDTFRLYETLEAGVTPLVDKSDYWSLVFDNFPVPQIEHVAELKDTINFHNDTYPQKANECYGWWQWYKRKLRFNFIKDTSMKQDKITVLIPTSPIEGHPDTEIIEKVIESVRGRLEAEIIIMFDGVRKEQEHLRSKYEEYKRRLLFKINMMDNVVPKIFDEHLHQAEMTRRTLLEIDTDQILFVEHDTPLCSDIPFEKLSLLIDKDHFNVIRLHHEAIILDDHKSLMLDKKPFTLEGVPMIRTGQWSQRPHLASKKFYQNILSRFFSARSRTMIEDKIHGIIHDAFINRGRVGWNEFKVGIYAPSEDMKRSYHLDGRGNTSKFEMIF